MLESQRHHFDIPDDICYLNCAYMAPRLKCVTRAAHDAIERGRAPWQITAGDFFDDVEVLRGLFATLIDAHADDIALVPSVSFGIGIAAANLQARPGQKILLLAEQFPSNVYPWRTLARQRGASVVTVARPADKNWTRAVVSAIDDDTAIAALPQAHWTDGSALDLKAVRTRCDNTGTALALDLTQSLGAVPFSVRDIRPDFAVAAAYKWLLGPYSMGFLYVAPHWHQGQPLEEAWMSRSDSRDFGRLVEYRDDYRAGARRYDVGEHSNFNLLPMAVAALQQILAWQVPLIAGRLAELTGQIAKRATELGFAVPPDTSRSPHMLGLRLPHSAHERLLAGFAEAGVHVSLRGDSLRIAPHLHIEERDLERFFRVLEKHAS